MCDGCGDRIAAGKLEDEIQFSHSHARFHHDCYVLWEEERRRQTRRISSGDRFRLKILGKLYEGALPDHVPEKLRGGFGGGEPCDACDAPIHPAQAAYMYELEGRVLRLHVGCAGLWKAEMLRPGFRRRQ